MTTPEDPRRDALIQLLRQQDEQPYTFGEAADEILEQFGSAALRGDLPKPDERQIAVRTLMEARDAARADWRLVVGEPGSTELYDETQASHFAGMAGWLKRRADKIAAGEEPDWPDAVSSGVLPEQPQPTTCTCEPGEVGLWCAGKPDTWLCRVGACCEYWRKVIEAGGYCPACAASKAARRGRRWR